MGRHRQRSARTANPKTNPCTARDSTKKASVLALLRRPGGASLQELMSATGWQAHSVRGFLSGMVGKKNGTGAAVHQARGWRPALFHCGLTPSNVPLPGPQRPLPLWASLDSSNQAFASDLGSDGPRTLLTKQGDLLAWRITIATRGRNTITQ